MRRKHIANDNIPDERMCALVEAHTAHAAGLGAVIDNLGWSIGDEFICSRTSKGCLTSEYKGGGNSDEIAHTME